MTHWDEARRLLRKADQDRTIFHVIKNHPNIESEAVCFHAQQAVEKSLKAVLMAKGAVFRRTHDLDELVDRIIDNGITLPFSSEYFSLLTPFAAQLRYEDLDVEELSLFEVERIMEEVYRWATDAIQVEGNVP
ncbi:MAG: HEPN domain-containing protein [Magnetococcus sp. DMHC-1]